MNITPAPEPRPVSTLPLAPQETPQHRPTPSAAIYRGTTTWVDVNRRRTANKAARKSRRANR